MRVAVEYAGMAEPVAGRVLLSAAAAGVSLGKFLELGLAAHKLRASCGHALLSDSLRFYATRCGVACFCYDQVRPNQIHFPAPRLRYLDAMQVRRMLLSLRSPLCFCPTIGRMSGVVRPSVRRIRGCAVSCGCSPGV